MSNTITLLNQDGQETSTFDASRFLQSTQFYLPNGKILQSEEIFAFIENDSINSNDKKLTKIFDHNAENRIDSENSNGQGFQGQSLYDRELEESLQPFLIPKQYSNDRELEESLQPFLIPKSKDRELEESLQPFLIQKPSTNNRELEESLQPFLIPKQNSNDQELVESLKPFLIQKHQFETTLESLHLDKPADKQEDEIAIQIHIPDDTQETQMQHVNRKENEKHDQHLGDAKQPLSFQIEIPAEGKTLEKADSQQKEKTFHQIYLLNYSNSENAFRNNVMESLLNDPEMSELLKVKPRNEESPLRKTEQIGKDKTLEEKFELLNSLLKSSKKECSIEKKLDKILDDIINKENDKKSQIIQLYHCDLCDLKFTNDKQYFGHISHHNRHFSCEKCLPNKVEFKNEKDLLRHEKIIHGDLEAYRKYKCDQCTRSYCNMARLFKHQRRIHQVCEKKFFCKYDLRTHLYTHLGIDKAICEICGRKFNHVSNYLRHARLHSGIKPYVCSFCGVRFHQINQLKLHKRSAGHFQETESSITEFSRCPICKKNFLNLRRHVKKVHSSTNHLKEIISSRKENFRNFHCNVCGKTFNFKCQLISHEFKEHSKEDLKCQTCREVMNLEDFKIHSCVSFSRQKTITKTTKTKSIFSSDENQVKENESLICGFDSVLVNIKEEDEERNDKILNCDFDSSSKTITELIQSREEEEKQQENEILLNYDFDSNLVASKTITELIQSSSLIDKDKMKPIHENFSQINQDFEFFLQFIPSSSTATNDTNLKQVLNSSSEDYISSNNNNKQDSLASYALFYQTQPIQDSSSLELNNQMNINNSSTLNSDMFKTEEEYDSSDSLDPLDFLFIRSESPSLKMNQEKESNSHAFNHPTKSLSLTASESAAPVVVLPISKLPQKESSSFLKTKSSSLSSSSSLLVNEKYSSSSNKRASLTTLLKEEKSSPLTSNEKSISPTLKKKKMYPCTECHKLFSKRFNLQQHLGLHFSGKKRYQCAYCQQRFAWGPTYQKHLNLCPERPNGSRPLLSCRFCDNTYSDKNQLNDHIKEIHLSHKEHYVCLHCSKRFPKKNYLRFHIRIHCQEKLYLCSFCGKGFNYLSHLERHEHLHTGERRPYQCEFCGQQYTQTTTLLHHRRKAHYNEILAKRKRKPKAEIKKKNRVSKRQRFRCEYCKCIIKWKNSFLRHLRVQHQVVIESTTNNNNNKRRNRKNKKDNWSETQTTENIEELLYESLQYYLTFNTTLASDK